MTGGIRMRKETDEIKSENLNGIYRELAELIGVEATVRLHQTHRGQTISLPVELFSRDYIAELIVSEYDGKNVKHLATKYGYSDKWIRKIIKDRKKEKEK